MLNSDWLQLVVFPFGVLYLMLHAGPLLRFVYEPSIRGGTRWQFFLSEVVLFTAWALGSPVLWHSMLGRIVLASHLVMHVAFTITDYAAHEFLLGSALTNRLKHPLMWFAKEFGLVVDTATHGIAVTLVAVTLPPLTVALLVLPAFAAFVFVTRGYIRRYGALASSES